MRRTLTQGGGTPDVTAEGLGTREVRRLWRAGPEMQAESADEATACSAEIDAAIVSGSGGRTARTQAACGARANGNCFRRGEREFGLQKNVDQLVCLREKLAIFTHPASQESFGGFLDPLLEQGGDLFAQIGGVVQARKLKTFEGRVGRFMQEIPWRCDAARSHS